MINSVFFDRAQRYRLFRWHVMLLLLHHYLLFSIDTPGDAPVLKLFRIVVGCAIGWYFLLILCSETVAYKHRGTPHTNSEHRAVKRVLMALRAADVAYLAFFVYSRHYTKSFQFAYSALMYAALNVHFEFWYGSYLCDVYPFDYEAKFRDGRPNVHLLVWQKLDLCQRMGIAPLPFGLGLNNLDLFPQIDGDLGWKMFTRVVGFREMCWMDNLPVWVASKLSENAAPAG